MWLNTTSALSAGRQGSCRDTAKDKIPSHRTTQGHRGQRAETCQPFAYSRITIAVQNALCPEKVSHLMFDNNFDKYGLEQRVILRTAVPNSNTLKML